MRNGRLPNRPSRGFNESIVRSPAIMVNQSLVILCLHYTRYLLDSFSCRHEILSGTVWTRQQLCNTSFTHIAHRIWIFTCAASILKLEPSDWHNHWLLVARLARRIFALLKKSQRIMWLEFLSWAAKELSPSEHSLIHLINDLIHKALCFCKGTLFQILLLWDGHDWKNGVNRTEINKRRINVRALATLRNYDGNRRVEKAIRKTTILQLLFSHFFFMTSLNNYSLRSCGKAIQVIRDQSLLISPGNGGRSRRIWG